MPHPTKPSRRGFVASTTAGIAALALGCLPDEAQRPSTTAPGGATPTPPVGPDGEPPACPSTSPQSEGPFWIEGVPVRSDLDLYGDAGPALALTGRITDTMCLPLAGAIVEIWHADPDGEYDNDSPEQRYRGQQATDDEGRYRFTTVQPGWYPGRPLHLHVKVWVDGIARLTTQLYFADDPESDAMPADLRVDRVQIDPDAIACSWDVAVGL